MTKSILKRIQAARTPLTPYTFGTAYDNAQERLQALKTAKRAAKQRKTEQLQEAWKKEIQ